MSGGSNSELFIFKENGDINLPEGYGTWVLPNLQVGDIIGIKEESGGRSYGIKTTLYQNLVTINENTPLINLEHELLYSKKLSATPQFLGNTKDFKIEKKDWNKQFDLYTITAHNPTFFDPEYCTADQYSNHTYAALSNYQSWNEIAQWYWDIASPTLVPNDSVNNIVSTVLKGKESATQYDKAQLLYKWVVNNINYSSQSFRQDNYVPQMPNKVIEDKLGDCKDMAALYILMCQKAGIKGNFVLVNSDTRATVYSKFPNNSFNHCIAKIYPDNKPLYVELTAKYLPFAHNTGYAEYGVGLEVDTATICTIARVYNPGKGDFMDINTSFKVENATAALTEQMATTGYTSSYLKDAFEKADSTQINTAMHKIISMLRPNSKIQTSTSNTKDKNNDSTIINYTLTNNDLFIDLVDLQVYRVPSYLNKVVEESVFANTSRKTDISFGTLAGYLSAVNNQIAIDIPKGKTLYKTPVDTKLSNQYFDFEINFKLANNILQIDKKFAMKKDIIAANDFASFKTEMEKAYKADIITIVIQ